jgi:hypothetical protein
MERELLKSVQLTTLLFFWFIAQGLCELMVLLLPGAGFKFTYK